MMNTFSKTSSGSADGRVESVSPVGSGPIVELAPGIVCEAQVGVHNEAVNLFTAIVTFQPGRSLPMHTHPHSESITLLSGEAIVEVENRRYRLQQFDNVTVPQNTPHKVINGSAAEQSVFHIAMPVSVPLRDVKEDAYVQYISIADDVNGKSGKEYITRFNSAGRYNAGSNTAFIDYFNESMLAGVGMSGGLGIFYKDGRLPAHFHAFDESICIISGEAICITQRNKYNLSNLSTALQPNGLPHYFINPYQKEMYMIWVYAGAMPVRTEVDDF
ncbi:cupin domain-containing protein [Agriterribacter sp.]|uniref:cupin domain-containing protein n=1 Tax=Agriterribacter sp. TaxID=2821509 RepID=UPI002B521CF6|nr:cupin domain-containing protein [Agriterribacter sp.]HRP55635.1 cupin domain-containing protein [Agriterribacter sp.]